MRNAILLIILFSGFSQTSNSAKFTTFTYPNGCFYIHCDQQNNVWYGGDNNSDVKNEYSLFKYNGDSWEGIKPNDDRCFWNCIISSPDGFVFFNTKSDIRYYKNDIWKWLDLSTGGHDNLMFDKNGRLIFSSTHVEYVTDYGSNFHSYLYQYDFQTKKVVELRDYGEYSALNFGFYDRTLLDYKKDDAGNLFLIETIRNPFRINLTKYDGNVFTNIELPINSSNVINNSNLKIAIFENHLTLYFYSSQNKNHILYKYENNKWTKKEVDLSGLKYKTVYKIEYDNKGVLWFVSEIGLFYLKDDLLNQFTENEGLLSSSCYDLDFDNLGNLWVAHEIGVTKIEEPYNSVNDYKSPTDFIILPNPTNNKAFLYHNLPLSNNLIVEIYSIDGKLKQNFESQYKEIIELDVSNLTIGMYLVTISNGISSSSTKLIIEF